MVTDVVPSRPYKILAVLGSVIGLLGLLFIPWIVGLFIRWARGKNDYSIQLSWADGFQMCVGLYLICVILFALVYGVSQYGNYCKEQIHLCCQTCRQRYRSLPQQQQQQGDAHEQLTESPDSNNSTDNFLPREAYRN